MELTPKALEAIKNKRIRLQLALALDVTDQTISNYIESNSDNLTKAAALSIIYRETGLTASEVVQEKSVLA